MVSFLKGRRREDDSVVAVDSSGRDITAALEALVNRAEAAANDLRSLAPILERTSEIDGLRERCADIESRVTGLDRLGSQLAMAEDQVERVIKTQNATEARIGHSNDALERLQGQMSTLSDKVETALLLREQVESFLSLQGPLAALRTDADTLRVQLGELAENVARMRTQHDDALTAHRHTTSRLENFDQDFQTATGKLEDVVRRVQSVERQMEPINQASTAIPDVQHQLAVLKALADQVAQKTTMLEQEREAIDRAATQIAQLTRMDRELDACHLCDLRRPDPRSADDGGGLESGSGRGRQRAYTHSWSIDWRTCWGRCHHTRNPRSQPQQPLDDKRWQRLGTK